MSSKLKEKLFGLIPMGCTGVFIIADCSQIGRMWTERTAAGQSLLGWLTVVISLIGYATFFRVRTPNEKLVFWCTVANAFVVSLIAVTVIYFRYIYA
jgi:hypothetical protein